MLTQVNSFGRTYAWILILLTQFSMSTAIGALAVIVPILALQIGLGVSGAAALLTLIFAMAVVAGIPIGLLGDHIDRRWIMVFSPLIAAGGFVYLGFANQTIHIVIAICVIGLARCGMDAGAFASLSAHESNWVATRGTNMATMTEPAGRVIGPIMAGLTISWVSIFAACMSIMCVLILGMISSLLIRQSLKNQIEAPVQKSTVTHKLKKAWANPRLRKVVALTALWNLGAASAVNSFLSPVLTDLHDLDARTLGVVLAAVNIAAVISSANVPALRDSWGLKKLLLIGLSAQLVSIGMFAYLAQQSPVNLMWVFPATMLLVLSAQFLAATLILERHIAAPAHAKSLVASTSRVAVWGSSAVGSWALALLGISIGIPAILAIAAVSVIPLMVWVLRSDAFHTNSDSS